MRISLSLTLLFIRDDMGLGKTVQIAALLLVIFRKTGRRGEDIEMNRERKRRATEESSSQQSESKTTPLRRGSSAAPLRDWTSPCLIICPASVIDNWKNELNRWGYFLVHTLGSNIDGECDEIIEDAKHGSEKIEF